MPHDVIMPALGMAQDTGLIVSWLKETGDAVRAGDALMEVETDKAVMEVEAPADGYLSDVRAAAGDHVPVGHVIAVIADAPGATADVPVSPAGDTAAAETPGRPVIMPALGMAQDTGKIVAWLAAPGDRVDAETPLFEVETDKATMEVPAGHTGFLSALLANAGDEVPVGTQVATIGDSVPEARVSSAPAGPAALPSPQAAPPPQAEPPQASAAPKTVPRRSGGPILASPKTRRIALQEGLDLQRLVDAGHPQPFHVRDLDALRALGTASVSAPATSAAHQLTAQVVATGCDAFLAWLQADTEETVAANVVWAGFASHALRAATERDGPLVIEISALSGQGVRMLDPDRIHPLDQPDETPDAPDLILRDLTASPITGLRLGPAPAPILTLTTQADGLGLTLDFTPDQMSDATAIALMGTLADCLCDPTRQLL